MNVVAIDIGGTNIRIASYSYNNGSLALSGEIQSYPVWNDGRNVSPDGLADIVDRYSGHKSGFSKVDAVGCAVAGMLDEERAVVEKALNVGWENVPLKSILEQKTHLPALIDTDAYAGAVYEDGEGVGRANRFSTFLYVAIGTGIGHAFVQDGEVWRGVHNRSNVFGHLTYIPGGRDCYCGSRGCVCQYAAGPGIVRSAVESGLLENEYRGDKLQGRNIVDSARAGNPGAIHALETATDALAVALSHAYNLLDHDRTVLAGGAISDYWPNLEELRARVSRNVHPSIEHIELIKSKDPGTGILRGIAMQTAARMEEENL